MIYDISQEVFSGKVYPGDLPSTCNRVHSMDRGAAGNASELSMNVHNATHIDAPFHKLQDGITIDQLDLESCIGPCEVIDYADKKRLKETTSSRVLLANCEGVNAEEADLLISKNVRFLGVSGQSIGDGKVHRILLRAGVVLLEGAVLTHVPFGRYILYAPPIKLGGCDGAPCRAVLVTL